MKHMALKFLLVLYASITSMMVAQARCIFPTPDGGPAPSPANVHGPILSVEFPFVRIKDEVRKKVVSVQLPSQLPVYTAFGGDGAQAQLVPGQTAWVWFESCRRGNQKSPVAAYFQIYSFDPKDRPRQKASRG